MDWREAVDLFLLFVILLVVGSHVRPDDFKQTLRRPVGILLGQVMQFLLLPALGYGTSMALGLDNGYAGGLVVMCCSPGGAISNALCFLVQADVALSVALTTVSNLVACGMMPLNLFIYLKCTGLVSDTSINYASIVLAAGIALAGTLLGLFLGSRLRKKGLQVLEVVGAIAGVALLILSLAGNVQSDTPLWLTPGPVVASTLLPPLVGSLLGTLGSRLCRQSWPSCVAIGVETSSQNKIIALAVIGLSFQGAMRDAAVVAPVFYSLFSVLGNCIWLAIAWKCGFTHLDPQVPLRELLSAARQARLDHDHGPTSAVCPCFVQRGGAAVAAKRLQDARKRLQQRGAF